MSDEPIFGTAFASTYDAVYEGKDYAAECDRMEDTFRRFGPAASVRTVLDLGCGTGNHALELARRGYHVTGVDRSREMLEIAGAKPSAPGAPVAWVKGDVRDIALGSRFDAACCMFGVLGYLLDNRDLLRAFANMRRHLRDDGLLLFDVWYGPSVLAAPPADRVRVLSRPGLTLLRVTSAALSVAQQTCDLRFHLWHIEGDRVTDDAEELHRVRYFFPREIELLLEVSGFSVAHVSAFPGTPRDPGVSTPSILVAARVSPTRHTAPQAPLEAGETEDAVGL